MRIAIFGAGYVGLPTATALAYFGHEVTCVERRTELVQLLEAGIVPLHEPGLPDLFAQVRCRIRFETELTIAAAVADVIFVCVGTPTQRNGDADLSYVEAVAQSIAHTLPDGATTVVVNKSTVPVGSARRVESIIRAGLERRGVTATLAVASIPEFLREGAALYDTFYPDRIVVGANEQWAMHVLRDLYQPVLEQTFTPPAGLPRPDNLPLPVFVTTTPTSAELTKYASNVFLAMKISYANEISGIADRVGADVTEVMRAVGLDARIGSRYLGAGAGWGGSCFRKDVRALLALGAQYGYEMPLASGTLRVNERQRLVVVEKLQRALKVIRGSTIGIWGLTFKPNTDDLRDAPALDVISRLGELGARVRVYDPVGMDRARLVQPDLPAEYAASAMEAIREADALVLMTEWDEFLRENWQAVRSHMRGDVVIDGRNALNPATVAQAGLTYTGMGR